MGRIAAQQELIGKPGHHPTRRGALAGRFSQGPTASQLSLLRCRGVQSSSGAFPMTPAWATELAAWVVNGRPRICAAECGRSADQAAC